MRPATSHTYIVRSGRSTAICARIFLLGKTKFLSDFIQFWLLLMHFVTPTRTLMNLRLRVFFLDLFLARKRFRLARLFHPVSVFLRRELLLLFLFYFIFITCNIFIYYFYLSIVKAPLGSGQILWGSGRFWLGSGWFQYGSGQVPGGSRQVPVGSSFYILVGLHDLAN